MINADTFCLLHPFQFGENCGEHYYEAKTAADNIGDGFGHKNAGNVQLLRQKCAEMGIGCDIIPPVQREGITVSSTYIRTLVEGTVTSKLAEFFEENPAVARVILDKAMTASRAREAARKAREATRRGALSEGSSLPGKLKDCQEKSAELTELYLVEGDSAGGTAGQGRNPR